MANIIKSQQDILAKLQIEELNPMQKEAIAAINKNDNVHLTYRQQEQEKHWLFLYLY